MDKNKVAIYCRLSKEDFNKQSKKDDSESIKNQKNLLTKYAIDQNWIIYKIYSDDDFSGLDRGRPEFNRLIEDAELRLFDIILCKEQSRFTRDVEISAKYLFSTFNLWGIRFVSVVDNVDTDNINTKKAAQINGLVNDWYCENNSFSIKSIKNGNKAAGKFNGAFAPYGYKKSDNNKYFLIVDADAANIVKDIFSLYLNGHGCKQIANILTKKTC